MHTLLEFIKQVEGACHDGLQQNLSFAALPLAALPLAKLQMGGRPLQRFMHLPLVDLQA